MDTEDAKIYHHHTPRFYLLPWADDDERIMWLGYGKIKRSGLTVVGGENHFYRLRELTERDLYLIREFIKLMPEHGRKGHEDLVSAFSLAPAVRRHMDRTGFDDPEARKTVDTVIANMDENFHTSIENTFRKYLNLMLAGHTSFYEDDACAISFLHSFSVQMLRTKAMKDRVMAGIPNGPFEDNDRVWPLISHICAATMGGSFFVSRRDFKIVLVDNHTDVPFITSDQPIINLLAHPTAFEEPKRVEFFYPLSPTKAMLYLERGNRAHSSSASISIDEAHAYNCMVADHSGRQIFSNSEEYLKCIQRRQNEKASAPSPPPVGS